MLTLPYGICAFTFCSVELESHVCGQVPMYFFAFTIVCILYNDYATTDKKQSRVSEVGLSSRLVKVTSLNQSRPLPSQKWDFYGPPLRAGTGIK